MNILLLNPPTPHKKAVIREGRCTQERGVWATMWPPVTLSIAGAMLEAKGHNVEILDCAAQAISSAALLKKIQEEAYELVAWSTATLSIKSDLNLANEIKKVDSNIKTAAFGIHVSVLAEECLREARSLDFVIRNEPEKTLTALAETLENETGLETIEGLSYRDADNRFFHNPPRPFIEDLDTLPFPAWHLLDLERYRLPLIGKKFLILAPTRGCPYHCTFCTAQTYYGKRLRKKSVPRVIDEIEYNIERFGINQFFMWADTFTADQNFVMRFCQAIQNRNLKINWACNSRVDTVDRDLIEAMAKAGCWMISYGIESGNQAVLDSVRKSITLDQSWNAVRMARQAGIRVAGHFVLGFPGETEETIKETINFALGLDMEMAQFYSAVPFPGSLLYELARAQEWINGKEYEDFRQDNAVMSLPGLPASVVNAHRRNAFRRFYLRPSRFLQMLSLIDVSRIKKTIKEGVRFLGWARS